MPDVDSPEALARFQSGLGLVEIVARQVRRDVSEQLAHDELVSFGREGLLVAARRYDPERGVPFRRYANYRVRGAMLDGLRSHGVLPRRAHEKVRALQAANLAAEGFSEDASAAQAAGLQGAAADQRLSDHLAVLATAMAVGFGPDQGVGEAGERVAIDPSPTPEYEAEKGELFRLVEQELDKLGSVDATFVRRHFFEGENLDKIARDLGLSKSWGSRIFARAMSTLNKRLRSIGE